MFFSKHHNQKGFSLTEVLIAGALFAGIGLIYVSMGASQERAMRGVNFRIQVYNMRSVVMEILKDTNNCTASVRNSFPQVPDLLASSEVSTLKMSSGETFIDYYKVGGDYEGLVKIKAMNIRPFDSSKDQTPGHKFDISFERVGEGLGPKTYLRSFDLFFDTTPSSAFPDYKFKCSISPPGARSEDLVDVKLSNIACSDSPTVEKILTVACPPGKHPVSCGIEDPGVQVDQDRVLCHINALQDKCTFTHKRWEACDVVHGHCYCL